MFIAGRKLDGKAVSCSFDSSPDLFRGVCLHLGEGFKHDDIPKDVTLYKSFGGNKNPNGEFLRLSFESFNQVKKERRERG